MIKQDRFFLAQCSKLNKKLAQIQTRKESVTDETCFMALIIVQNLLLADVGDALLYASSLNVLDAYVKQSPKNKKRIGYFYKSKADLLARFLTRHPNSFMRIEMQKDNDMSLMIAEICGIQFTFLNVRISEKNERYAAKDYTHPCLSWDGIHKQNCAKTLFSFCYNASWHFSDQMFDGSCFTTEMAKLLNEFHAGTKNIEDVLHMLYGKDEKNIPSDHKESIYMREEKQGHTYPFRSMLAPTLYKGSLKDFLDNLGKRHFVSHIETVYSEGFGYTLHQLEVQNLKYGLESLASVIHENEYNPDSWIRLDCFRSGSINLFTLMIFGYDADGVIHLSSIAPCLLDTYSDFPNNEHENSDYTAAIHSQLFLLCLLGRAYLNEITGGIQDRSFFVHNFICYCYDVPAVSKCHSIIEEIEENLEDNSIFFLLAEDRKKLYQVLKPALTGKNGNAAEVSLFNMVKKCTNRVDDLLMTDHNYIVSQALSRVSENQRCFTLISGGSNTGKDTMIQLLMEKLSLIHIKTATVIDSQQEQSLPEGTQAVIYNKYIPDTLDFEAIPYVFLIYNPYTMTYDALDELEKLKNAAAAKGIPIYHHLLTKPLGFSDGGGGINFLLTCFGLASDNGLLWNVSSYPITLVDTPEKFTSKEGIANIIVGSGFTYNPEKKSLLSSRNDQIKLYNALFEGTNGVNLYIENEPLRAYVRECFAFFDQSELYQSLMNCENDPDKAKKLIDASLSNSVIAERYARTLIRQIGQDNWDKLSDSSRDWMIASLFTFTVLERADREMDFSGSVLQACKVVEHELGCRLIDRYAAYLKKKYGDREMYSHLPTMLVYSCKDGSQKTVAAESVSLCDFPRVMGMNKRGKIVSQREYEEFLGYCSNELFIHPQNAPQDLARLCIITDHIRADYRNKAAHSNDIDYILAKDCIDYCILKDNIIGWIMGLFRE